MSWEVRFTPEAEQDLLELYSFLAALDASAAGKALAQVTGALGLLESFPYSCRKAESAKPDPFLREMIISFGSSGYVALFRIESEFVTVLAIRHQRESDFH